MEILAPDLALSSFTLSMTLVCCCSSHMILGSIFFTVSKITLIVSVVVLQGSCKPHEDSVSERLGEFAGLRGYQQHLVRRLEEQWRL